MLIARDDRIPFEHYQYGRTDRDRLISQSMAKSLTAMLIGIAIGEGAIKSVDDAAETYVPGFRDTEYGKTPIRDLLTSETRSARNTANWMPAIIRR